MITKPICFILGAGASMDFGFPSGILLLQNICKQITQPSQSMQEYWQAHGQRAIQFATDLQYSGKNSVDAFLESRPDYMDIGKMAIASCLIPYENPDKVFSLELKGKNWYDYLWEQIAAPLDRFGENRISFLTYNYDRSLEFYLETVLRANNKMASDKQIAEALSKVPIVHLHGNLGNLPIQGGNARHFSKNRSPENVYIASQSIKIIHEDIANEPQFIDATRLLGDANEIAFLGFGYHETNLMRLNLPAFEFGLTYGTAYGMTPREIEALTDSFDEWLILHDKEILPFLRETGIITKPRMPIYPKRRRKTTEMAKMPVSC